jgi:hypothetical protein
MGLNLLEDLAEASLPSRHWRGTQAALATLGSVIHAAVRAVQLAADPIPASASKRQHE